MCITLHFPWVLAACLLLTFQISVVFCHQLCEQVYLSLFWVCFETSGILNTALLHHGRKHVMLVGVMSSTPYSFSFWWLFIGVFCCSFTPITAGSPFYPLERLPMSVHAFLAWCLTWKSRCLWRVEGTSKGWFAADVLLSLPPTVLLSTASSLGSVI